MAEQQYTKAQALAYCKTNALKGQEKELVMKYFMFAGGCMAKPMTDDEYHKLVLDTVAKYDFKMKGLNKLGVELEEVSEIEPIPVVGWEGGLTGPSGEMSQKYGVTWIYFSDKQIYVYQAIIDMLHPLSLKERAEEYFYKDVTNIATTDDAVEQTVWQKSCMGMKPSKVTINKSSVRIVVPGDQYNIGLYPKDNEDFENKIRAAKAKLREKKA